VWWNRCKEDLKAKNDEYDPPGMSNQGQRRTGVVMDEQHAEGEKEMNQQASLGSFTRRLK